MTKTDNKFIEIKLYSLDENPKKCKNCNSLNNSSNTLCWYCNFRFEKENGGK